MGLVLGQAIRGLCASLLLFSSTTFCGVLIFVLGLVKLILPFAWVSSFLHLIYRLWCKGNLLALKLAGVELKANIAPEVHNKGWYLLVANHISWLDIIVLTAMDALPAPKFFLKDELKYVPLIGSGAWALGMPFMKRASKAQIAKNPKLKGLDVARTQQSCKNFRHHPTTVINFAEGTRFTPKKHANQGQPYQHLLKPKAGGTAFALQVLDDQLDGLVHATLVYHGPSTQLFRSFMQGRLKAIDISFEFVPLNEVPQGDYQQDKAYRVQFQHYLNVQWRHKDTLIEQLNEQQAQAELTAKEA